MTPRRRRMTLVAMIVGGVAAAVGLSLLAFQENLLYFYTPTQLVQGDAPAIGGIRLGGMVAGGSREPGSLVVTLEVTDFEHTVPVIYEGVLPDLLTDPEGNIRVEQGVVVEGRLDADGRFVADRVLAKHDEEYMPAEIKAMHDGRDAEGDAP